ncbi:class V aminotransferase [Gottschalkia acidurici 9a]|uniref:Class V aminotransferase n=1 Tax=Gottschalkia acidurici (strain ATCC 7906 / DSM 604 / BCRC 14475 / CIP 104303 / KCTC 5404 / NCIMB 10678 / 9a) TaxID=1128398 RepID=K0B3J3_GOTA9|nr:alanine--glyoxylate aminotransferase family protein [Gottschalkia acidurici]AFS79415.1 class V aminotransferase [Gottschalkia acidurici 9a]
MRTPFIMTPGPTQVHEEVRKAMSREATNPDLDENFYEFYKNTCNKIKRLLNTENQVLILDGEGILGLEAACASLTEQGDRVLCIDNGIFGKGFGDFSKMYGGEVVYFESDYRKGIDVEKLEEFLKRDSNFKYATLVHCETPAGITNPIDKICTLLNKYGVLSVVDSVSSVGGDEINVDEWKIDIALGGSQKCISAPSGLTFLSISEKAMDTMINRKTPIAAFYCNLTIWKGWYEEKWFPYTQPINAIYALDCALDRLLETDYINRHKTIANATREALVKSGLELYPLDSYSNTVTTFLVPEGINFEDVFEDMMKDHNIMIGGAFDYLKGKVIRIGHMGENCYEEKIYITLKALDTVLKKYGAKLNGEIYKHFVD